MPYLELDRLRKAFSGCTVVHDLELAADRGQQLVLLGPSGCGKSTILRMVAGLLRPDSGRIRLDGADITTVPPHRRQAPMVFQDHLLFPHLTVAQNVAFGLRVRGEGRPGIASRVRRSLAQVGLTDLAHRYPAQLSGGQRQRVALARALVLEPRLLLLDEPFSNLDTGLRQEMRDLLQSLRQACPVTTVLVTHDQDEAMMLADRVAVIFGGRLAQVGTPAEIWSRPASRQVAEFVGGANLLPGHAVAGRFHCPGLPAATLPAASRRPDGAALAVVRPESVRLLPAGAAGGLPGRVRLNRFAGGTVRYQVECGAGLLEVRSPAGAGPPVPPGTPVRLDWDPAAVWYVDP